MGELFFMGSASMRYPSKMYKSSIKLFWHPMVLLFHESSQILLDSKHLDKMIPKHTFVLTEATAQYEGDASGVRTPHE